jgi:hypothetical protein
LNCIHRELYIDEMKDVDPFGLPCMPMTKMNRYNLLKKSS